MRFSATGSARQRPRTLSPPRAGRIVTSGPPFVTLRQWERTISLHTPAKAPEPKAISYQDRAGNAAIEAPIRFERSPRRICQRERRSWHEPSTKPDLFPVPHRFANDLTILQIDRPSWRFCPADAR